MFSIKFHTTSDLLFPPAALPINFTWDALVDLLTSEIGPDLARLIAEPKADAARRETHWFVEADRDPVAFDKLGAADREALQAKLTAIQARADARAAEVEKSSNARAKRQAEVLRAIVRVPDPKCLWSLDGEPLLSCWGRHPALEDAEPRQIVGVAVAKTVPEIAAPKPAEAAAAVPSSVDVGPAVAADAPPTRRRWGLAVALWLLFLALTAYGYARLLPACGLASVRGIDYCPVNASSELAALGDRNQALRQALRDRAARLAPCETPTPGATHGPERADATPDRHDVDPESREHTPDTAEVDRRRDENHIGRGKLDVTLAWNGHADLDLRVTTPCGEIMFRSRESCGGRLDHDANGEISMLEDRPVEHVQFDSDPPRGHYKVVVTLYSFRDAGPGPVAFTVSVRDGETERSYNGVIASTTEPQMPVEFDR